MIEKKKRKQKTIARIFFLLSSYKKNNDKGREKGGWMRNGGWKLTRDNGAAEKQSVTANLNHDSARLMLEQTTFSLRFYQQLCSSTFSFSNILNNLNYSICHIFYKSELPPWGPRGDYKISFSSISYYDPFVLCSKFCIVWKSFFFFFELSLFLVPLHFLELS